MIKLCTVDEVRRAEEEAAARDLSFSELMARAGQAVAALIEELASCAQNATGRRALFLVGPGKNGGDGLVAAGLLAARGWDCSIWTWNRPTVGDVPVARDLLERCRWVGTDGLDSVLETCDVIIDAVFGIGGRPTLPDDVADVFAAAYRQRVQRGTVLVAVDVPSGIDSDTGAADPRAFRADLTVMIGLPKVGAYRVPALRYTGVIEFVDIGLPRPQQTADAIALVTEDDVRDWLPRREADTHKWAVGSLLVVGGAPGYYGAPRLAAAAALRSGTGLVTLAVPRSLVSSIAASLAEVTFIPAPDGDVGAGERWAQAVRDALPRYAALLVGPGLGQDRPAEELVRALFGIGAQRRGALGFAAGDAGATASPTPFAGYAVVDADGLNWLAKLAPWHENLRTARLILTPHPGELARLLGTEVDEILADPWKAAREAACRFGQHVVLKTGHPVVAAPDGSLLVAPQTHAALATAGTGDVLAGVIAGLAAQGLHPLAASAAGLFVANQAALRAVARRGTLSMLAGDIVEELPSVLRELYDAHWLPEGIVRGLRAWSSSVPEPPGKG